MQHFDDEPALRHVVRPVAGVAAGRKATTEERLSNMERRLDASDKMLQEVHAMVRGLQQLPAANALPALLPIEAPAAVAALEWIAKSKLGATAIVHVIDDFLFIANSRAKCGQDLQAFVNLCLELGVPLAPGKTVAPTRVITFLGITLDTVLMEVRLPEDKLEKAKTLLEDFQRQQKVTLRVLQSLIGILNFACTVIVPGRAFLRRIIDMTVGVQKPHHHIRLTRQAKLYLQVWQEFLLLFNGRSFFLDDNFLTGDHLHCTLMPPEV